MMSLAQFFMGLLMVIVSVQNLSRISRKIKFSKILLVNLQNQLKINHFWQLISFVYTDKLLRPWQKVKRHLWPSRKYNILRYGTKLDLFLNVSVKYLYEILSWNLENLSEFDQFWQLISIVYTDKSLRPCKKFRRHF